VDMARIKLAYIGGGSTRGAGTMASFIHNNGAEFDGSEVVLVDLDPDRLALIRTLAEKMARARGVDLTVTATTDRRAALHDGEDAIPHIEAAWERRREDPELSTMGRRILHLGATMGSIPAGYFMYYYFRDEIVGELAAKATTRAEDIMGLTADYWRHYEEQAK